MWRCAEAQIEQTVRRGDKLAYHRRENRLSPEETGYHSGRILALDEHFARMMERGEIEGAAYCISKNGKVIAEKGMGLAHYYDHNDSMRPDTIHGIASITKTFTAAALMKLVEDGYTRLDVKVGDILPSLPVSRSTGLICFIC